MWEGLSFSGLIIKFVYDATVRDMWLLDTMKLKIHQAQIIRG